ncbi:MAG: biopolymer transporter ExbD [Chlamydiales bacterium]|nr:biopolymer transporter ExbD [Chlamydiia bacterium]MCP5507876.1 biopolymer transporter ExbD [Chlamydiales bacterium]
MARHAAIRTYHARQSEEPTVNLTPLIDVVFVILIMFILVAPLLEMDRVELADASDDPAQNQIVAQEQSAIAIHVNSDDSILFNQQPVSVDRLGDLLKHARQRMPEARPQVFHDKRASFGTYQAVKNAAESAGFHEMDIVLKPAGNIKRGK